MKGRKNLWSIEGLKIGFERFFQENHRYPSAVEIDACDYLPSARQLQRRFGGVPELRRLIGLSDLHFGKGKFRSAISYEVCKRGAEAEEYLERELISYFGEPFVHIEKPIAHGRRRVRCDFYIYAKDKQFAVDIFWSGTRDNIMKNLDSKINSYKNTTIPLYLVMANKNITQDELDEITKAKYIKPIPKNAKLITLEGFLRYIRQVKPLLIEQ